MGGVLSIFGGGGEEESERDREQERQREKEREARAGGGGGGGGGDGGGGGGGGGGEGPKWWEASLPDRTVVRKEIRSMPKGEQRRYANALKKMMENDNGEPPPPRTRPPTATSAHPSRRPTTLCASHIHHCEGPSHTSPSGATV